MEQKVADWSKTPETLRDNSAEILRLRMRPLVPTCIDEDLACGDRLLSMSQAVNLPWMPRTQGRPYIPGALLRWIANGLEVVYPGPKGGRGRRYIRPFTTQGALKRYLNVRQVSAKTAEQSASPD